MISFEGLYNKLIKIYKGVALSDLEVLKIVKNKARVMLYNELSKYKTLDEALGKHGAIFLLYENQTQFGHWTADIGLCHY